MRTVSFSCDGWLKEHCSAGIAYEAWLMVRKPNGAFWYPKYYHYMFCFLCHLSYSWHELCYTRVVIRIRSSEFREERIQCFAYDLIYQTASPRCGVAPFRCVLEIIGLPIGMQGSVAFHTFSILHDGWCYSRYQIGQLFQFNLTNSNGSELWFKIFPRFFFRSSQFVGWKIAWVMCLFGRAMDGSFRFR